MSIKHDNSGDWASVWPIDYSERKSLDISSLERVVYAVMCVVLVVGAVSIAYRVLEFAVMMIISGGVR